MGNREFGAVREGLRAMLLESGTLGLAARQCKRALGWTCSDRAAESRLSHMLRPEAFHKLHTDVLEICMDVAISHGSQDLVTPVLHRRAMRAEDRREAMKRRA